MNINNNTNSHNNRLLNNNNNNSNNNILSNSNNHKSNINKIISNNNKMIFTTRILFIGSVTRRSNASVEVIRVVAWNAFLVVVAAHFLKPSTTNAPAKYGIKTFL